MRPLSIALMVILPAVILTIASPAQACSTVVGPLEDCSGPGYVSYKVHTIVGCVLTITIWYQSSPILRGIEISSESESDFCAPEPQGIAIFQRDTWDGSEFCVQIALVLDVDECSEITP